MKKLFFLLAAIAVVNKARAQLNLAQIVEKRQRGLFEGKAVPLTQANRKHVEALKKARGLREAKELDGAQALAKQIEKAGIAIAVKTGEGGKLFGAVTANDIHAKLTAAGITLEKRRIHLGQPIKTLGKHEVKIKLHPEVSVELTFDVVSENPIEPAASA